MNKAWKTYTEALFRRMPSLRNTLGKGASEDEIRAAEEEIGIVFPEMLRTLYLDNNGDTGESVCGMMLGFGFYDLDTLCSEWRSWKETAERMDETDLTGSRFTSEPVECIKRRYADPLWIPICGDGGGNHIGIDLDPDVKGRVGQVINFGRDEESKTVLAESLNAFLERLTRIVNSDDFFIGEFDGDEIILLGSDDEEEGSHLTDYLRKDDSVK